MRCPICGRPNQDDWPVTDSRGVVVHGGCQRCWEDEVDAKWLEVVTADKVIFVDAPK